jgi:flagellar protein FlaE
MGLNPNEYDIDELREAVGGEAGPAAPRIQETAERHLDGRRAEQYRELLTVDAAGREGGSRPHLDQLPQEYAAELIVLEWLEFLNATAGLEGTIDAIRYYRSIGWISEAVESDLRDYLSGVDARDTDAAPGIDVDDHVESLLFVANLASMT